jgi:hypothetical protein
MSKRWGLAAALRGRGGRARMTGAGVMGAAVAGGLALAVAASLSAAAAAPGRTAGHGTGWTRGSVVSSERVAQLSRAQAESYLQSRGYGSPAARQGVSVYRIVYRTISPQGKPDTASGVLALPAGPQRVLQTVEFGHGTMVARADAPSVAAGDRGEVTMFAGAGYAAVEPDYLGLGLGPGHQPYLDPAAETSAAADMLRAADAVAAREHRRLAPRVLVTGFSEGGQGAMALGRVLQQGAVPHLRLGAVAPVSGPYDLLDAQLPAALSPSGPLNPKLAAFYLSYWVVSSNWFHHLYTSPSQVFRAPYDATVPGLEDGRHSDLQVLAALPASPQQLVTPAFLGQLEHPSGELLRLIRADDVTCTSWVPQAPVRLYAAHADTQVSYQNSVDCQHALAAHGRDVPLVDLGALDHFPSEHAGLPRVLAWFEQLQPPGAGR